MPVIDPAEKLGVARVHLTTPEKGWTGPKGATLISLLAASMDATIVDCGCPIFTYAVRPVMTLNE